MQKELPIVKGQPSYFLEALEILGKRYPDYTKFLESAFLDDDEYESAQEKRIRKEAQNPYKQSDFV